MQNSSSRQTPGRLFIVATPIGNLEDITLRALNVLKEVDLIACEDTRQTVKLLNKYGIKKRLISYFHPRENQKIRFLLDELKHGKDIAIVSDAGTPGISDPGFPLIRDAIKESIEVIPIPGPSAVVATLSASGLPSHRFLFLGFCPAKKVALNKLLASISEEKATLIFFVPARKISWFLEAVFENLGNRKVVLARELTKVHEEFIRGDVSALLKTGKLYSLKGEITAVISGLLD